MTVRGPRYSRQELRRRAEVIFERDIRPSLAGHADQEFVLIEVETGDYEIDADQRAASDRLHARHEDAQVWARRVGSPHAIRLGRGAAGRLP
jgi:hypothetical protein